MKLELQTRNQHNVLRVAVDHLIDHLLLVLTGTARDLDNEEMQDTAYRLFNAAVLKERLAALNAD